MTINLLQANINHACQAQDNLVQTICEQNIAIALIMEPYRIPVHPNSHGEERVAITWQPHLCPTPCIPLAVGPGYVAVRCDDTIYVACYIPPKYIRTEMESCLIHLGRAIDNWNPGSIIIAGDFNSKSAQWGCPHTDFRGRILSTWIAAHDLCILNRGAVSTCVRWQGESIIDLTLGSPSIVRRLLDWRVAVNLETLSDHRFISVQLRRSKQMRLHSGPGRRPYPAWNFTRINIGLFMAALTVGGWTPIPSRLTQVDERAEWLIRQMQSICDVAMPRSGVLRSRPVYWWTDELALLRQQSVRHSRAFTRARKRREPAARLTHLYAQRKEARQSYKFAIRNAKARAWIELLDTLNRDYWGRPYRLVMGKLRPFAPPLSEKLDPMVLEQILATLFPAPVDSLNAVRLADTSATVDWLPEYEVTQEDLDGIVRRLKGPRKAPGPDEVLGRIWSLAMPGLGSHVRQLFTDCLRAGIFPAGWKTARLVLLKKPNWPDNVPSSYRPLCLLNDVSKLFERLVVNRMTYHMETVGPNLSDAQFGFRRRRSTLDAVIRAREVVAEGLAQRGVVVAVSLDIENAFNWLSWDAIREALAYFRFPSYICRLVHSYLSDHWISYTDQTGMLRRREVVCGVPQGSVWGPFLWDLTYDQILRLNMPANSRILCYADDTLLLAGEATLGDAIATAELRVAIIARHLQPLGLKLAVRKTEVITFAGRRVAPRLSDSRAFRIGNDTVPLTATMRYLGLTLDSHWDFNSHFRSLLPRVDKMITALGRMLPNLHGPDERVRRLYVTVLNSVLLYGAPVWVNELRRVSCRTRSPFRRVQRQMALRTIRAYRTVSYDAATALARIPPLDLLAIERSKMYQYTRQAKADGYQLTERALTALKKRTQLEMLSEWKTRLSDFRVAGRTSIQALLPELERWYTREHGQLTYRMTQLITGHGVFGDYLFRIQRALTPVCEHCGEGVDTAYHTIAECSAWTAHRRLLRPAFEEDLSLRHIISVILESEEYWQTFANFSEAVMLTKKAAERARQLQLPSSSGQD